MPEEMRYEITQKPTQIAARLRKMADQLESGTVTVVEQEIDVAERIHLKIEFEEQYDDDDVNFEIEVEIKWPIEIGEEEEDKDEEEE